MLYVQTSVQYKWKATDALRVESMEKHLNLNQGEAKIVYLALQCYLCYVHNVHVYCRPKHPTKVHVWARISKKGRTEICIFDRIMKKELFISILEGTLLPFVKDVYPDGHKLMQDSDPQHTS